MTRIYVLLTAAASLFAAPASAQVIARADCGDVNAVLRVTPREGLAVERRRDGALVGAEEYSLYVWRHAAAALRDCGGL